MKKEKTKNCNRKSNKKQNDYSERSSIFLEINDHTIVCKFQFFDGGHCACVYFAGGTD